MVYYLFFSQFLALLEFYYLFVILEYLKMQSFGIPMTDLELAASCLNIN